MDLINIKIEMTHKRTGNKIEEYNFDAPDYAEEQIKRAFNVLQDWCNTMIE